MRSISLSKVLALLASTFSTKHTRCLGFLILLGLCVALASSQAFAQDTWTTKAPMPTPRSHLAAGVVNGVLYAVGGYSNGNWLATVEAYDPTTDSWTTKAPMPTPRSHLAAGVVNGVLYAVGGYSNGNWLATVEAYDPTTNTWTTKAPMPTQRFSLAIGVVNGILYAVGGYNINIAANGWLPTVEAYDPTTDTWTTKAPMPTARGALAAGVVNGLLYAVGGIVDSPVQTIFATVEAYDPTTNTWTTKAPMPTARWALAVSALNGLLYADGGANCNGNCPVNNNEAYDATTDTWAALTPMPTARGWLAAGAANGDVYAVGGSTCNFPNTCPLATNEAYLPQTTYTAQIQQPINSDGSSVFNSRRGTIPVIFTLAVNGVSTCNLPPATIALYRTSGSSPGLINESSYIAPADSGSSFRISSCQYVYNLDSKALGVGIYQVTISINSQQIGSATFGIN